MDKTAALERLSKLESEAAELRKIIEQPEEAGLWEPEDDGCFFSVSRRGKIECSMNGESYQKDAFSHGNCFRTESIARKAAQLQRKYNFYLQACFQTDLDAGEWSEERCICIYRGGDYKWVSSRVDYTTDSVCVHTREQAREACGLLNAWQAKEDAK